MNRCSYPGCGNRNKWSVHGRFREMSRLVCGVHLSREVTVANTFDDERYKRRTRDEGVRVIAVA